MTSEQLLDIEACRALIIDFAAAIDAREPERMRAMLTPDASFARPTAPDVVITGADTIIAAFAARPPSIMTQHLNLNLRIRLTGPDTAVGESVVMLYIANADDAPVPAKGRPAGAPLLGTWRDSFVRTAEGWRFHARRGAVTMYAPG